MCADTCTRLAGRCRDAVHDAGHTQVAAGALTAVAVPPGVPDTGRLLRELAPVVSAAL